MAGLAHHYTEIAISMSGLSATDSDQPPQAPKIHPWAAGGIVLSSGCALGWAVALRTGNDESKAQRLSGLMAGSICMAGSVLLPWHLPRLPKEDEILTFFAFVGLCLAMIRLAFQTAGRVLRRRATPHGACGYMERP